MNKLLTLIAATFIALTGLLGSGAEAGFNLRIKAPTGFSALQQAGCHGGGGYFRAYHERTYSSVRRVKKVDVAKAEPAQPATVAKAEIGAAPVTATKTAEIENSSIATTEGKVAEVSITTTDSKLAEVKAAQPEQKVAVAKDVGCNTCLSSAGMTLTVPCE